MYWYGENIFPGDKWIRIMGLLFQNNLIIAYFTTYRLKKKNKLVDK